MPGQRYTGGMGSADVDVTSIERDGQTLSVRVRAGSPTVLLLHGLAGHGGEWAGVRHYLPDEVGVVMPDQRGHGESFTGGATDVAAATWVDDAVACIESFADAPVTVVGQSMGAIVATHLAAARADLVDNLVLIEGGMAAMTDEGFSGLAAWFDSWPRAFTTRREATKFFGADEASTKAWVDGLQPTDAGLRARFDQATMLQAMRELAGTDSWHQWASISIPTVIMRATSSAISDDDVEQMQTTRPDVEIVTIAGGHDLHLDEPEIVAGVIARAVEKSAQGL